MVFEGKELNIIRSKNEAIVYEFKGTAQYKLIARQNDDEG